LSTRHKTVEFWYVRINGRENAKFQLKTVRRNGQLHPLRCDAMRDTVLARHTRNVSLRMSDPEAVCIISRNLQIFPTSYSEPPQSVPSARWPFRDQTEFKQVTEICKRTQTFCHRPSRVHSVFDLTREKYPSLWRGGTCMYCILRDRARPQKESFTVSQRRKCLSTNPKAVINNLHLDFLFPHEAVNQTISNASNITDLFPSFFPAPTIPLKRGHRHYLSNCNLQSSPSFPFWHHGVKLLLLIKLYLRSTGRTLKVQVHYNYIM
jgi:hypothetical protein